MTIDKKKEKNQKVNKDKNPFQNIIHIWRNGDNFTRLSFFIMGLSNLVRKQFITGFLFITAEIGFLFYMLTLGATALSHLDDLGEVQQGMSIDPESGLPVKHAGDNSMLLLLAGVIAIFICIVFIVIWYSNLKAGYEVQKLKQEGKHIPSFFQTIQTYFDKKIHRTLIFLPCIGILIFNILPLVFMILIAFTNFDSKHQPPGNLFTWVGIKNFATMLNSNSIIGKTFWPVLGWTVTWAICSTFLNYIFGMVLALIINRKETRFKKLWRTIFVLSIAVPSFVALLTMNTMFQENGPINTLLKYWGLIDKSLPFFTNATWARVSTIIINLWVGIPYTMIITTGILQNIPEELYESAKVDGANAFVTFFKITLPYMIFVTTPYLITQFVGNINNFNVLFFLTGGNPLPLDYYQAGKTDLLVTWLYKLTVNSFDYSYAAVIGIFVFVLCAGVSLITYRNTKSYKNEEEFQ